MIKNNDFNWFLCFSLFSTMWAHVQACVCWLKYTTDYPWLIFFSSIHHVGCARKGGFSSFTMSQLLIKLNALSQMETKLAKIWNWSFVAVPSKCVKLIEIKLKTNLIFLNPAVVARGAHSSLKWVMQYMEVALRDPDGNL